MKQGTTEVVLLVEIGNKVKGGRVKLSSTIAAKLIKDGKAEKFTGETKPEVKKEVKHTKTRKK